MPSLCERVYAWASPLAAVLDQERVSSFSARDKSRSLSTSGVSQQLDDRGRAPPAAVAVLDLLGVLEGQAARRGLPSGSRLVAVRRRDEIGQIRQPNPFEGALTKPRSVLSAARRPISTMTRSLPVSHAFDKPTLADDFRVADEREAGLRG